MKKLIYLFLLVTPFAFGQELKIRGSGYGGMFSLGTRTTISTFNGHEDETNGLGVGGQFRVQFANRLNTDWYFDYLRSNIGDYASRTDYHIGWSVMFYPTKNQTSIVKPYILAGHCFDNTEIVDNADPLNKKTRLSSAVQGGLGFHLNLSPRLDLSFVGQYMIHLGGEIHAERQEGEVFFEEATGSDLEGHLLFHIGINYKIADLW